MGTQTASQPSSHDLANAARIGRGALVVALLCLATTPASASWRLSRIKVVKAAHQAATSVPGIKELQHGTQITVAEVPVKDGKTHASTRAIEYHVNHHDSGKGLFQIVERDAKGETVKSGTLHTGLVSFFEQRRNELPGYDLKNLAHDTQQRVSEKVSAVRDAAHKTELNKEEVRLAVAKGVTKIFKAFKAAAKQVGSSHMDATDLPMPALLATLKTPDGGTLVLRPDNSNGDIMHINWEYTPANPKKVFDHKLGYTTVTQRGYMHELGYMGELEKAFPDLDAKALTKAISTQATKNILRALRKQLPDKESEQRYEANVVAQKNYDEQRRHSWAHSITRGSQRSVSNHSTSTVSEPSYSWGDVAKDTLAIGAGMLGGKLLHDFLE